MAQFRIPLKLEVLREFLKGIQLKQVEVGNKLRLYQVTVLTVLAICTLLNLWDKLFISAGITAIAAAVVAFSGILIKKEKYDRAYLTLLFTFNITLLLLSYVKGIGAGSFMFFYAAVVSFQLVVDAFDKNKFRLTLIATASTFLVIIIFMPSHPGLEMVDQKSLNENYRLNTLLSFGLVYWMSYILARHTGNKHEALQQKHAALQSEGEFLDAIFNCSPYASIIISLDNGSISHCNDQAVTLFASSDKAKLKSQTIDTLFTPSILGGKQYFVEQILNPAKSWKVEVVCNRLDGTDFSADISMVPFNYGNRHFKKISVIDITEKNRMLQELRIAKQKAEESAEVKIRFLSNMSHELRTPLNGIIGVTNIMLQERHYEEQKDNLSLLKFSSEHMHKVINDILDLSKLDADKIMLEKIPVNIPELINSLCATFSAQYKMKGINFEVTMEGTLEVPVLADPTRINQVLSNLLSNALKFTDSGTVKLKVNAFDIDSNNKYVQFSVKDSGIGISAEKQSLIFDPFTQADLKTTRKYGGTGLGLTISRRMVALMGGILKVESEQNRGSEFSFNLNFQIVKEKIAPKVQTATEISKLNGLKILIAEDHPVNLLIATKFMDKWGIKYTTAKNGLEAVAKFKDDFDLVLMDIEMPEMDGYAALKEIRKTNTSVPVIAFTAGVFDNIKQKMEDAGFESFIRKPFKPDELSSKILEFTSVTA